METPSYIKGLLTPNGKHPAGRKVWSVDLETVWLPFFTATNTMGDTAIPNEALGAPLRLAYDPDGSVKFSKTGRPVIKVVKEVADSVKMVRDNFVAGLMAYTHGVAIENPDGYKAQAEASITAGRPILDKDRHALLDALAEKAEAKARPKARAQAKPEPQAKPELVAA